MSHSVPSQWYHSGDATSNRETEKRETEKREKERERKRGRGRKREEERGRERRERARATEIIGEIHMGTKREVTKACRSVLSQWYHSGDATSHGERERREREREV